MRIRRLRGTFYVKYCVQRRKSGVIESNFIKPLNLFPCNFSTLGRRNEILLTLHSRDSFYTRYNLFRLGAFCAAHNLFQRTISPRSWKLPSASESFNSGETFVHCRTCRTSNAKNTTTPRGRESNEELMHRTTGIGADCAVIYSSAQ